MYYSKILEELTKQERNPVNKMYLSEISLKWKNFQQATESAESTDAELASALSQFLNALHNRKFIYSKIRGTGFSPNSTVFSAAYLYDLASALMHRQPILKDTGISWDFQELNYAPTLSGNNLAQIVESPRINSRKTPSLLSLSLKVEFQYRIAGKRNFIKDEFKIPLLLFFVHKTLNPHHIFQIEHYAALSKNCFSASQTFVLCETLGDCSSCNIQDLPLKIFALKSTEVKQNFEISNDILEKLDRAIKNAINALPEPNLIKEPEPDKPKKQNKTTPRKTHRTYKRKK